jgi:hypothetical protein
VELARSAAYCLAQLEEADPLLMDLDTEKMVQGVVEGSVAVAPAPHILSQAGDAMTEHVHDGSQIPVLVVAAILSSACLLSGLVDILSSRIQMSPAPIRRFSYENTRLVEHGTYWCSNRF